MSTQNPTNSDINWVKPKDHPCKLRFQDIQSDWDNDYENLVNLVQTHTNCSTAYCLCKKGESVRKFVRKPILNIKLSKLKPVKSTIKLK